MLFQNSPLLLLTICAILYKCNAQEGQRDIPPTATLTIPATTSLVLQPKQSLARGVIYANPKDNPFLGNLLPGPITPAIISVLKDSEESNNETCVEQGQGLNQTWADLLQERLFPNGTTQQVGFPRDILPFLDDRFNTSVVSEITRGRFFERCDPKNKKHCYRPPKDKETTDHHYKRKVFSPDEREEVLDTRFYPYNTIGIIGNERCTGVSPFLPSRN